MFCLKCCPRCGGDLHSNRDEYGRYLACVQCGHYLTEAEEIPLGYVVNQRKVVLRPRAVGPVSPGTRPFG
jgi:DNA-directed RNA polymerase subunit M/transcription elongation factor TFIIS